MLENFSEVNRVALEQLGHYKENERDCEEDYQERLFQARFQRGNYGKIVDDVADRIAKAAFGSHRRESKSHAHLSEDVSGILDWAKNILQKPGVKEGLIIGSVMLFKMGLWFSYRKAAQENLDIIQL